jgi:hypothetical protein
MATLYAPDVATNPTTVTTAANFIKELWSDEVLAVYKANTVLAPLVQSMPFSGQKGDTVHVPKPTRGSLTAKTAGTGVTINVETAGVFNLVIDQHFEYSRLIEDIAKIQALDSMRSFYTDDAGYAHALSLDAALHSEGVNFDAPLATATDVTNTPAYAQSVISTVTTGELVAWDDTTVGNGVALTDAGIRRAIQYLDDNNVPARMRQMVIPPVEKNNLLGLARFTEQAFTGEVGAGNSIRNGLIGDIYGIPVYVSTNCNTLSSVSTASGFRQVLLFQKEAVVLAEQLAPRAQSQYKQEFLADLFTTDTIYGLGTPRPEAGVSIIVPA